jgi:hypothetical protein
MKTFCATVAAIALLASAPAAAQTVLPEGAALRLSADNDLSSQRSKVGDPATFTVAEDVILDGQVLIPQGAKVSGRVTHVQKKSFLGTSHPGELDIFLEHAAFDNGRVVMGIAYQLRGKERGVVFEDKILNTGNMQTPVFFGGGAKAAELKRGEEIRIEPEPVPEAEEIIRRVVRRTK